MNTAVVKTQLGRTILVQLDETSPGLTPAPT